MTAMDPVAWERAKQILGDALLLEPAQRDAFVRQQCADNPALCTDILALLALQHSTDFLEPPPAASDQLADLKPGVQIGRYTIIDRIGRGGMGQVFLAKDPDLGRKVALKCLLTSSSQAGVERARILNEARAAAAVNHPNVATIYDVLEHGDRAFIIMEYVEGESLGAAINRERMPFPRVARIGRLLAAALKAAHAHDVIHRDIKPANIQVTFDSSVKVLDFGVARARASGSGSTRITTREPRSTAARPPVPRDAFAGGTPPYMSPEQLRGGPVDHRSDIFSLGVVLFELATGRRPFHGDEDSELLVAQMAGAPPVTSIDARVPAALADVIAKALKADRSARYQTAGELESALEIVEESLESGRNRVRELFVLWLTRVGVGAVVLAGCLWTIGFLATLGFNSTFGRSGPFSRFGVEPWPTTLVWGLLAVFPSLVMMTLVSVAALAARGLWRMMELIGPVGRFSSSVRDHVRRAARAMAIDRPEGYAQALAAAGVVCVVATFMIFLELITALTAFFNSAPLERLLPMGPDRFARQYYLVTLDVLLLAFGVGLYQVIRQKTRGETHEKSASVSVIVGVLLVLLLMKELPYRILNHRDFERVPLDGVPCYITGESGDEVLVLCPSASPPRNRIVKKADLPVNQKRTIENVFEPVRPVRHR